MTRDDPREASIAPVKGTADRLPSDFGRLARIEQAILDCFNRAGYDRLATPVLEPVELHERKSGAGIVSKLFLVQGTASPRVCLRPELTAGVVRAYTATEPPPALPWRVSHAGSAFRHEDSARPDRLREFRQVGLERLGDSGPFADAEVIWLATAALAEVGIADPSIRVGHVGLILELLTRSGLPASAQTALIEMLSEATSTRSSAGWTTSTAGSAGAPTATPTRSPSPPGRRTTRRSTGCSGPWCRSSRGGGRGPRSSTASGASGP